MAYIEFEVRGMDENTQILNNIEYESEQTNQKLNQLIQLQTNENVTIIDTKNGDQIVMKHEMAISDVLVISLLIALLVFNITNAFIGKKAK